MEVGRSVKETWVLEKWSKGPVTGRRGRAALAGTRGSWDPEQWAKEGNGWDKV